MPTMADAARQGRSASICAPGCSSMEAVACAQQPPPPDSGGGTPVSARRRRPAARSQSARIAGGKSVRRRAPAGGGEGSLLWPGGSEPRLADAAPDNSPGFRRKGSSRRSVQQQPRKSAAFLDVPDAAPPQGEDEDEDSYRLRSFSLTSKGVVNRGDSFRRRRSRSNSLVPPPQAAPQGAAAQVSIYRVAIIGAQGVGKSALISQFMTSECINAYDRQTNLPREQSVSIMLNGEESELRFLNIQNMKDELDRSDPPDAFVVMYSVIDKASFQRAEAELTRLADWELLRVRPAILVGNKVDLVRSRAISPQDGKCLACTYRAKFIEVSVGISHNIDELLVGILSQIRLKNVHVISERDEAQHWYKSRGVVRASMKARQMLTWIFGKEDSKFKNCENLNVP